MSGSKLKIVKSGPKDRLMSQIEWLTSTNRNMVVMLNAILQRNGGEIRFDRYELHTVEQDLKEIETSIDPETRQVVLKWNERKPKALPTVPTAKSLV